MRAEHGHAVLILVVTSLIGLIVLEATWFALRFFEMTSMELHQSLATAAADSYLLRQRPQQGGTRTQRIEKSASAGKAVANRAILVSRGLDNTEALSIGHWNLCPSRSDRDRPIIDFDRLSVNAISCPAMASAPLRITPRGTRLSLSAAQSRHTCKEAMVNNGQVFIEGNLAALELILPATLVSNEIVTTGYLEADRITTSSDLLLVAGGDIAIRELKALGRGIRSVTVISLTGAVALQTTLGPVALRTMSCGIISAPQSAHFAAQNVLLPPLRDYAVLALERGPWGLTAVNRN